jgi:hypothetical protein
MKAPEGTQAFKPRVGSPWRVLDYPWDWNNNPMTALLDEGGPESKLLGDPIMTLTVFGTKIGGHVFWIQDDSIPKCRCKKPMQYLGQFASSEDLQFGDCGIVYVFYCAGNRCRQTKIVEQCF